MAVKPSSNIEQLVEIKESLKEFVLIARVLRGDIPDPPEVPDHTKVGRVRNAIERLERALNPRYRAFGDIRRRELRRYGWPYDHPVILKVLRSLQGLRIHVDDILIDWKLEKLCEQDGVTICSGKVSVDGPYSKGGVIIHVGRDWPPAIDGGILHVMEGIQLILSESLAPRNRKVQPRKKGLKITSDRKKDAKWAGASHQIRNPRCRARAFPVNVFRRIRIRRRIRGSRLA